MENVTKKIKEILLIEDRKKIELNDVEAILSFESDYITLETTSGKMVIEGRDMKIVDLSKDTGHISIVGAISAVSYDDDTRKKKGGLFKG